MGDARLRFRQYPRCDAAVNQTRPMTLEKSIKTVHILLRRPLRAGFDVTEVSLRRDCDSDAGGLMRLRRQQNTLVSAAEMRGSHLRDKSGRSAA